MLVKQTSKLGWQGKLLERILLFQPFFAIPVYFSVICGVPSIWAGLSVALLPLLARFVRFGRFIDRTPFDIPILLYFLGLIVGLIVASDNQIAFGALASTIGSCVIYYGIAGNAGEKDKYWIVAAGIICVLIFAATIWFFSQGDSRKFVFNQWAFDLFKSLPKTDISLQMHSIGSVLSVAVPGCTSC